MYFIVLCNSINVCNKRKCFTKIRHYLSFCKRQSLFLSFLAFVSTIIFTNLVHKPLA